ncbi:uncharacterized protein LOC126847952 [Adelges cooleyi]|uniref:uncharacterized protein LOC126847952 n=1 Tax=Adelges cooleyi TaxID=133065 RepID=UPI00217F81D1|nr:uncharacterized protein LOC126847952 [Adelges cooleyi]
MRVKLSFIFLLLKLVLFYSSTDVNGKDDDDLQSFMYRARQRLHNMAVLKPTGSEITTAIRDSTVSQDIQIDVLQQFFYVGQYPVDLIRLMNKSKTLCSKPITFSDDEITTLTSSHNDQQRRQNRIVTQMKFYRKLQEMQCANYVQLKFILPDVEGSLEVIADYVYNIIDMAYKGKFVVSAWLWKLHLKLLALREFTLGRQTFLNNHLPEIDKTLIKLIALCRQNEYLMKNYDYTIKHYSNGAARRHLLFDGILKIYDQKYHRFVANNERRYTLHIGLQHLLLSSMWRFKRDLFYDISGLRSDWESVYNEFEKYNASMENQYENGEWTAQPLEFIKYQEIVLDVIKAKVYSYIWIHLVAYQAGERVAPSDHDSFIFRINFGIGFIYTDDQIFNEVLIAICDIRGSDDGKINDTVRILSREVNRILSNYTEPNHYEQARIDSGFIERICKMENSTLLKDIGYNFDRFISTAQRHLDGLNLNLLLFYIIGNKTIDYVLPNKR